MDEDVISETPSVAPDAVGGIGIVDLHREIVFAEGIETGDVVKTFRNLQVVRATLRSDVAGDVADRELSDQYESRVTAIFCPQFDHFFGLEGPQVDSKTVAGDGVGGKGFLNQLFFCGIGFPHPGKIHLLLPVGARGHSGTEEQIGEEQYQ